MKKKNDDTILAVDDIGNLFIDASYVAPILLLAHDGARLALWPDTPNRPYMLMEDAIAWSEREERSSNTKERKDITAALRTLLEKYKAGKFVFTDDPDAARAAGLRATNNLPEEYK